MTTRYADHVLTGTTAARPSASSVPAGTLYASSTDGVIYQSSGSAWGTWLAAPATGIAASLVDAKGDLLAATANDTVARLPVGTDGQILTADSASTPGVKWATAAAGGGDLTLLYTLNLGSAGTFDQASISGSYSDLILVATTRDSSANSQSLLNLRLNNDSGATSYYYEELWTAGTSSTVIQTLGWSSLQPGRSPGSGATANSFATTEITIYGYASTTWLKSVHWLNRSFQTLGASDLRLEWGAGLWNSTAAVTRVQLAGHTFSNLAAGSQLRIYGRK